MSVVGISKPQRIEPLLVSANAELPEEFWAAAEELTPDPLQLSRPGRSMIEQTNPDLRNMLEEVRGQVAERTLEHFDHEDARRV